MHKPTGMAVAANAALRNSTAMDLTDYKTITLQYQAQTSLNSYGKFGVSGSTTIMKTGLLIMLLRKDLILVIIHMLCCLVWQEQWAGLISIFAIIAILTILQFGVRLCEGADETLEMVVDSLQQHGAPLLHILHMLVHV